MTNIAYPEQKEQYATKASRRPQIQEKVELEKEKLKRRLPNTDEKSLNQYARDKVAAELVRKKLRREKAKSEYNAYYDPLTGLPNRRWFEKQLKLKTIEHTRSGENLWIIYFDIDNFKKINTIYGHDGGDSVLRLLSTLPFRTEEPIARWGGDEFVQYVSRNITEEQICLIIKRYQTQMIENEQTLLEKAKRIEIEEPDYGLSFGVSKYITGENPEEFIKRANLAMLEAKRQGKKITIIGELDKNGEINYRRANYDKIKENDRLRTSP